MVKPGLSTLHVFSFGISISLDFVHCYNNLGGFPDDSVVKNSPASAGDMGSISESGRSSGEVNVNPLHYSCLGNPMDREEPGGLQSMESAKSQTRLSD